MTQEGALDRQALANVVFHDPIALQDLESMTHPLIRERIDRALAKAAEDGTPFAVLEAIKLIESEELARRCDEIWLIDCPPDIQRERLIDRGMGGSDMDQRLAIQARVPRACRGARGPRHRHQGHGGPDQGAGRGRARRSARAKGGHPALRVGGAMSAEAAGPGTEASARPHRVADNRMAMFYAGGERIDRFRGLATPSVGPEDWVASVTQLPGAPDGTGISWLPDGTSLRAAVAADPIGWLGEALAARWGGSTGVLVKLLDAGERLPVHCHPSRPFATEHLASPFGKTEGWVVLDDTSPGEVWLGWSEDVSEDRLRGWIETQDAEAMLAVMNRFPAGPGDVFLVPAGVPHAIGPGVFITELQEPTAFSILAEHARFGLDADGATLGMGWETALGAFDRSSWAGERSQGLRPRPEAIRDDAGARVERLFPESTAGFFQALRVRVHERYELPAGFSVLVIESGAGQLAFGGGELTIRKGETWVVPSDAGPVRVEGEVRLLVCLPPTVEA